MKKELAQWGLPVLRKIQKTAQNHPKMTKVDKVLIMEHKNKWYKFGSQTWCYKPHPSAQAPIPDIYHFLYIQAGFSNPKFHTKNT